MVCMMEKHTPHPFCFPVKTHFNSVDTLTSWNSKYLPAKKSLFTHEMLLNGYKVGVWCATSANTFIKPIFITTNSHRCVMHILRPLFKHLSNYKNTYAFSSKTVEAMLCAVQTAFSQHIISRGLWPCLPDQNLSLSLTYRAW
jgi:hypothetical protein